MRPSIAIGLCLATFWGCSQESLEPQPPPPLPSDACSFALTRHPGEEDTDQEIRRLQKLVVTKNQPIAYLERLGWAFVSKARLSFDPGYYALADQVAQCIDTTESNRPEALLLRGHLLHQNHRFQEGEQIAKRLVTTRGLPYDYGLLGDLLLEQGKLAEAGEAYQAMMDLRPGPQAYSRGAQLRWLTGDLDGAIEMMAIAVQGASSRDRESAAWLRVRLALFQFQKGNERGAERSLEAALALVPDYPPALLARGRRLLGVGKPDRAVEFFERARQQNPLPEYQWAYIEALEQAGRKDEATKVEAQLVSTGAQEDRRTLALYLATRGKSSPRAVELMMDELEEREDVFSLDALAWSHFANGDTAEARRLSLKALSAGTADARLHFHAGVIAQASGEQEQAKRYFKQALTAKSLLWPSEQAELTALLSKLESV